MNPTNESKSIAVAECIAKTNFQTKQDNMENGVQEIIVAVTNYSEAESTLTCLAMTSTTFDGCTTSSTTPSYTRN